MIIPNNIRINSDDFGYSEEINRAIDISLQKNWINSCSLMANFDVGFKDALYLIKSHPNRYNSVGIHFNLTEGVPLTEGIKNDIFFCENGVFHSRIRSKPIFYLSKSRKKLIENELIAQFDKILNSGVAISHIDSHHHVHTEWAIAKLIVKIAKRNDINSVRISRNIGKINSIKKVYKWILNGYLKFMKVNASNFFGDFDDYHHSKKYIESKHIELMVHCIMSDSEVVDLDNKRIEEKLGHL
jgi:predicted glycoside hydrolase/deacetylase ChbG (UPF0249 family)